MTIYIRICDDDDDDDRKMSIVSYYALLFISLCHKLHSLR